jgi:hypothetical protein
MFSRFPRLALLALVVWPLAESCSHSAHSGLLKGSAPSLQSEDAPRLRTEGNPNAPYLVASTAKPPQLMRRTEPGANDAAAGPCDSKNLEVTEIAASVNGDYHAVKLAFYNQGLTPCKIGGFPNVSLLDQNGNPISRVSIERVTESAVRAKLAQGAVQQASGAPTPQTRLVIAPRGEAWFQMGWTTGDECPEVSRISVSAPGSTETYTINHPLAVCDGRIEITALHPDNAD